MLISARNHLKTSRGVFIQSGTASFKDKVLLGQMSRQNIQNYKTTQKTYKSRTKIQGDPSPIRVSTSVVSHLLHHLVLLRRRLLRACLQNLTDPFLLLFLTLSSSISSLITLEGASEGRRKQCRGDALPVKDAECKSSLGPATAGG